MVVKSGARAFPRRSVAGHHHHTVESPENMRFHASRDACDHGVSAHEAPPSRAGTPAWSQHNRTP
jgi:hypothetical protein